MLLENKELLSSISVLYVEDDERMALEMQELFKTIFKSVDTCSNGQEGLIQYTTKIYDIVITDIKMPILDGLSMTQEIRYINPEQSIIIFSAYEDREYYLKARDTGVDGFIIKLFELEKLITTLVRVSDGINNKRELLKYQDTMDKSLKDSVSFKTFLKKGENINLVLLDIDNFSNINDAYGIEYGNLVLDKISKLLQMFHFENIDMYKLESDEFALVNTKSLDIESSKELAKFIISFFNESKVELDDDLSFNISFSIGISVGSGLSVLNQARLSIKELRSHTRGTYNVYDMKSTYMKTRQDNVYWINKIQESVINDTIVAFYQPIINNHTKKIEKYECLARVFDDDNYISPYHFMDAAKSTRLTSMITKSIIKQACKMFSKTNYEFSINITNDDLQMEYLEEYLLRATKKYNINPNRIVLELLEDISTLEKGNILQQLNSLSKRGFKLAIDDFGSESSNFSRLLEFSPNYLKIDGAFIKNILTDKKSQLITEGIVHIAHQLNIKVIAEYIHSQEVQDKIEELGIDYSQGYFHGEPLMEIK
ncbi:MAG: EAL domain-containing protein [Sulfurimonas sp.]|nr:EAL domain-containing protein [Sulfurimonas sp.]